MSRKITMLNSSSKTYAEVFSSFITAQAAKGVADITIRNYHNNLHNISKFFDIDMPFADLTKRHLDEMIVEMRRAGLAHNTITTYCRYH